MRTIRRRIISVVAPPPSRSSNPVVPRAISQQQAAFVHAEDIVCIIFLNFFSNHDYSFIDLKSVCAFRRLSKEIAAAIDKRLEEIHPNYPKIMQMSTDAYALVKLLSRIKVQANSSVIVCAGFSPYKIKLPKIQVVSPDNRTNSLITALLKGSGSSNYAVIKKIFDDAFQDNELLLSWFFRNLLSFYKKADEKIYFVSICLCLICLAYHQLRFDMIIGLARKCEIINDNYQCTSPKLISCEALRSVDTKTDTTLWGLSIQILIDFCAQQESLCHLYSSEENFHLGNQTLTRICKSTYQDHFISNFLVFLGVMAAIFLSMLTISLVGEYRDQCRAMIMNWLRKPLSEKFPVVWSEKTARNVNNFFNPSEKTAVTILDELPVLDTSRDSSVLIPH